MNIEQIIRKVTKENQIENDSDYDNGWNDCAEAIAREVQKKNEERRKLVDGERETFACRLKNELDIRDLTNAEFAKSIDSTYNTVVWLLKGWGLPKSETIIKVVKSLNLSSDYLLGLSEDRKAVTVGEVKSKITSERISKLMDERNLKVGKLATSMGMSQAAVFYLKNGERMPSGRTLILLSKELHVTTDYLLGLEEDVDETKEK